MKLKRWLVAVVVGLCLVVPAAAAVADGNNPDGSNVNGQAGYEGQPGNQSSAHHDQGNN